MPTKRSPSLEWYPEVAVFLAGTSGRRRSADCGTEPEGCVRRSVPQLSLPRRLTRTERTILRGRLQYRRHGIVWTAMLDPPIRTSALHRRVLRSSRGVLQRLGPEALETFQDVGRP